VVDFGLPPAEIAIHPGKADLHEFYLMCDDVEAFISEMKTNKIDCTPVHNERWAYSPRSHCRRRKVGVYQPGIRGLNHERDKDWSLIDAASPYRE